MEGAESNQLATGLRDPREEELRLNREKLEAELKKMTFERDYYRDKGARAIHAWMTSVEALSATAYECYEREIAAPRDNGQAAYCFILHELSALYRRVAPAHNAISVKKILK